MEPRILKHVIKTFLLILVISFVADKIIFFGLNKMSDKVYSGQTIGKLNQYLEIKDSLDFIVYGSSRALHNIDPLKLSKNSFNMGLESRNLAYSATLIKLLASEKEQTILLHIDNEHAFNKEYSGNDIKPLLLKYNRNKTIKKEIDKLEQNNILQNFYWTIGYNNSVFGILRNYVKPNYDYKTFSGYDPIYVSKKQRKIFKRILERDEEKDKGCENSYVLNSIYKSLLLELDEFCKENNKTLILFTSPKYEDNCKDDNLQFSQIMKNMDLTYYDYTDFFKNDNNLDYWFDKGHISSMGAELFTEEIAIVLNGNKSLTLK